MVPLPAELEVDPAVLQALGVQPGAGPGRAQQVGAALLQHPGPLPGLAVGPAAQLDDHRVDAAQRQQVRQQQAGPAPMMPTRVRERSATTVPLRQFHHDQD